jgi:mercuric ion binding protein
MKRIVVLSLLAVLLGSLNASAKNMRKVTFKVQQMVCQNCEKKVQKNIAFEKGLKELKTNLQDKTVTIVYDADKTSVENLKKGFSKFNYEAKVINDVAADTKSKLPKLAY